MDQLRHTTTARFRLDAVSGQDLVPLHAPQRVGLRLAWRGPDRGNPDPTAVRLVYSDRALSREQLARLIEL